MHGNALFDLARWRRASQDLLLLAIPGEFAAKFSGLELYRLVTSIVRLICGRSLRLSAETRCYDRAGHGAVVIGLRQRQM